MSLLREVENMNQSDAQPSANYVTCRCQYCDKGIEFDASTFDKGETRTVPCPHCGLETIIFVPENQRVPPVIAPPSRRSFADDHHAAGFLVQPVQDVPANEPQLDSPSDFFDVLKWYRKAAEQGHAEYQLRLGNALVVRNSVPQDYIEAVKWFRKAAEQGDANAQSNPCKPMSGKPMVTTCSPHRPC
jgi:FOG: TPR repeat, SEL1 subfamily